MNLDIVYDVWSDLDAFYASGRFTSWEDMMNQICLVADGKPRVMTLLSVLWTENYSSTESLKKLQELSNIFQFVTDNFTDLLKKENWSQELYEGSKEYLEVLSTMLEDNPALFAKNDVLVGKKTFIRGLNDYFANPYALNYLSVEEGEQRYCELLVDDRFFEYTPTITEEELSRIQAGCANGDSMYLFIVRCLLRGNMFKSVNKYRRTLVFRANDLVREGDNVFGSEVLSFKKKKLYGFEFLQGVKKDVLGNSALLLGVI